MERRFFIKALGAAAATLTLFPRTSRARPSEPTTANVESFANALREAYAFDDGLIWPPTQIEGWTRARAMSTLTNGISGTELTRLVENPAKLTELVRTRIRADAAAGNVIEVRGWTVTNTEAAVILLTAPPETQPT